jgi:putative flippase GtrA
MIKRTGLLLRKIPNYQELSRFAIIGILAALVNFIALVALVSLGHIQPLLGNVIAFLIAFQVSYHGHKRWTFSNKESKHRKAMTKFFIVAGISFLLNEGLFALLLKETHLYYPVALLLVLIIVPPITFVFSKVWAFR